MAQSSPSHTYPYNGTSGTANWMDQILIIEREKAELRKLVDDQCAISKSLRSEMESLEHENETLRKVNTSLSTRVQSLEKRVGRFTALAQRMENSFSSVQASQRVEAMSQPSYQWTAMAPPLAPLQATQQYPEPMVQPSWGTLSSPSPLAPVVLPNTLPSRTSPSPADLVVASSEVLKSTEPLTRDLLGSLPPLAEVPESQAPRDSLGEKQYGTAAGHRQSLQKKNTVSQLDTSSKMLFDECPASPKTAKDAKKSQWGESSPKGRKRSKDGF